MPSFDPAFMIQTSRRLLAEVSRGFTKIYKVSSIYRNFRRSRASVTTNILAMIIMLKTYNYEMPDIVLRMINERMIEAQLQELTDKWNESFLRLQL